MGLSVCVLAQSFNCTDLDAGLNDGVDADTGVPNLPFSADFCATAQTLNDALVFCAASLEARPFPPSGQGLLDNLFCDARIPT